MTEQLDQLSTVARNAVFRRDWRTVAACSREILSRDGNNAEGRFLAGLAYKAANRGSDAAAAFEQALAIDAGRHDAAVELASQLAGQHRHAAAAALLDAYSDKLHNSPVYLNMAGSVYAAIGLAEKGRPLFARACELQPGVDLFESNLAASSVFVGRIDEARRLYRGLLERYPAHQRYHYQLSRIDTARDRRHVDEMQRVLRDSGLSPEQNVFMYYAIGKELEDLECWAEAFDYFEKAGNAVARVADYDINDDLELIETIVATCNRAWLGEGAAAQPTATRTPVFVVGLPRSGTTLVDRILSSHTQVASVGEAQYLPMAVRGCSRLDSDRKVTPEMIRAAGQAAICGVRQDYLASLGFRLGDEPFFIDKLPFNVLYLGFVAKAFPEARLVLVRRHPMDACFAMYKQVFTGAYKFSYTQEALGRFYVAYANLVSHWQDVLGDRITTVDYESLVARPEDETRRLLDDLGLDFERGCLDFDSNESATATASAVQVRQGIHTRSVARWRRYERQLEPLCRHLAHAGIEVA